MNICFELKLAVQVLLQGAAAGQKAGALRRAPRDSREGEEGPSPSAGREGGNEAGKEEKEGGKHYKTCLQ